MSFLDELKKARGEKSSAFLQFKLNYSNSWQDIQKLLDIKNKAGNYFKSINKKGRVFAGLFSFGLRGNLFFSNNG